MSMMKVRNEYIGGFPCDIVVSDKCPLDSSQHVNFPSIDVNQLKPGCILMHTCAYIILLPHMDTSCCEPHMTGCHRVLGGGGRW